MTEIAVANGWYAILAEAIGEAAKLPDEWIFEITSAKRAGRIAAIDASYNPFDMPWDQSVPPPWPAWQKIKNAARHQHSAIRTNVDGENRTGRTDP